MNETISIIIPIYNTEPFLKACLDSIIAQTYTNIEIICVNDGSADSSRKIVECYKEKDPRVILLDKKNGGLSSARNCGLAFATGTYVMFVDSDDWIEPDICELAINTIQKNNVDLVLWSYVREYKTKSKPKNVLGDTQLTFDKAGVQSLHRRLFGLIGEELACPDKGDTLVTAWGKLYRRSLIKDILFYDTKDVGTEDCLFNITVFSRLQSAIYLPVYGYHYRKYNAASLTSSHNPRLFEGWQNMYCIMREQICSQQLPTEYEEALSNRRAINLIALGINIVSSDQKNMLKIKEIRNILTIPIYQDAFQQLKTEYLPAHWKAFFFCAKRKYATGIYLLLLIIQKIRGR